MIGLAIALMAAGILLGALCNGFETGFYRVTRVRLLMDRMSGLPMARWLLWIAQRPGLYVSTALVGNNVGNEVVTLAIVLIVRELLGQEGFLLETVATLLFTPILFVYLDLLPKQVFFNSPYRLLRLFAPVTLAFTVVLLPLTVVLWAISRLLGALLKQPPVQMQTQLADRELQQLIDEGHQAGLLRPGQRGLALGLFAVANQPVREFATPIGQFPVVSKSTSPAEVLRIAARQSNSMVAVDEPGLPRRLVGYLRVVDVRLAEGRSDVEGRLPVRPLLSIPGKESHIAALMRMHNAEEEVARVVDDQGRTIGLVTARQLSEPLFHKA